MLLDRPVQDQIVLTTVGGAEDLLTGPDITDRTDGAVTCRIDGSLRPLHGTRLYLTAAVPLADEAAVLRSADTGVLSALDEPVRFRIAPGTPDARALWDVLVDKLGWSENTSDWAVNFVADPSDGGRWLGEIGPLHWSRNYPQLERLPWSTKPVVAEVMVRLAKVGTEHHIFDPFCGTGTILLAAHPFAYGRLVGSDRDEKAIELARENVARAGITAELSVGQAEKSSLASGSIDRVITNLPFGKLVGSHGDNAKLYPAVLKEIARVLRPDGRAVLLTEDKRLLKDSVARTPEVKIVRERLLKYSGASPTVFVLSGTRRRQTRR
ncbi:TRM11 family SAM-dependent methyltransferase [Kribbella italica]|uniref:SAM-dependent methyltransferase n=1 Tax=Kribbella italica TaxID=1540520 RepID=A0A7W9J2Y6_9ACTN|nr:methyltransferase domain-containing protein [Kribbella italica]MBB5834160.1 SAM-dependent methyltransferase [Kribbella italica]